MPQPPSPLRSAAALLLAVLSAACAKDVVLADQAVTAACGNGALEEGEECDVASAGCVACVVTPNWTCTKDGCTQRCGDGIVSSSAGCENPRRDTDCDMTGYWAARESDYERDSIVGSVQASSNWFLYRLEQRGDAFFVTEYLDCGVHVTGLATVDYPPSTLRAVLYRGRQDAAPHGPRSGTSKPSEGGCAVTFDRWYKVRGASESYLPADFSQKPPLASLSPLPAVADPVGGSENPPGAEDWDGDGIPGLAFAIGGLVSGVRNSAQRDWKEYATDAGRAAPAGAITFSIPGAFDLQDSVLRVTDCGSGCALLASAGRAVQNVPARFTFSFIGKNQGDPRVARVVAAPPRQNLDADLSTCANVRLALPHDPSLP